MRKRFFRKRLLPLLLALSCLPFIPAAAEAALPDSCAVTLSLTDGDMEAWPEIKDLEFSAHLYKVGTISAEFAVTPLPDYAAAATAAGETLSALTPETPAETVMELALALQEQVTAEDSTLKPDFDVAVTGGQGVVDAAPCGLYLLTVDPLEDKVAGSSYASNPVLLWVPRATGIVNGEYKFDTDVKALIKLQKDAMFGKLVIEKQIDGLDENYPKATFVFSVKATVDGKNGEKVTILDSVYTINFDGVLGANTVEIDGLPAGAEVTVEEIYGPGYVLASGSKVQTVVIQGNDTVTVVYKNTPTRPRRYVMVENDYVYKDGHGYAFERRYYYENGKLIQVVDQ